MTQAFNLSQLANNLNTSGQLDATDGLTGLVPTANLPTIPVDKGGTGITAVGSAGNVLTSNGTAWVSQAASSGFSGATINAPSATALTLTNTSAQCQIVQFTSTTNSIINLPNATTLTAKGAPIFRLINDSQCNANVFVKNATGTTLTIIPIKGIVDVTLEDNSTSAGGWLFSTVNNNPIPAFFDSASVTNTTVPLGLTPLQPAIGMYGIQLSDTSYVFAWLQSGTGNTSMYLRAVGATLSGSTFSFGTPANSGTVSTNTFSEGYICGFRLNATTAIFDTRTVDWDGASTYTSRVNSIVVTLSGNTVTVGSPNANNAPTGSGNSGVTFYTGLYSPVKCRISDTAFATVYQTTSGGVGSTWYLNGSGNLNCTITTVSGTTQTNGTAVTIAANVGNTLGICSHTNNGLVLSYFTNGTTGTTTGIRKAVAASVSGTVPTFGTPVSIDLSAVPVYKPACAVSFNAVAFSATKVFLPFYFNDSLGGQAAYFGVCTISGNTVTYVANSIFQIQEPEYDGRYYFELVDSNSILQYTQNRNTVYKYALTASNISYYAERYLLVSDLTTGTNLSTNLYAINYTQGASVGVAYIAQSTQSQGVSNNVVSTTKVTLP